MMFQVYLVFCHVYNVKSVHNLDYCKIFQKFALSINLFQDRCTVYKIPKIVIRLRFFAKSYPGS